MATQQEMQDEKDNYGLAFDEADAAQVEQSEDEAFGLTPDTEEMTGTDSGEGSAPAVSIEIASEAPAAEEAAPVETGESPEGDAQMAAPEAGDAPPSDGIDVEKERQRLKSWEGRLKAMQADIDAKKGQYDESGEDPAEEEGESASEEMSEGEAPTLEQAVASLSQDFGDEFVKMIQAIARGEAHNASGEAIDEVGKTVEAIINDMNDTKMRTHFERIHDAHPDFMDVAESPAFAEWLSQNPNMQDTVESGSAKEINALLDQFKAAQAAPEAGEPQAPEGMDDAEGVRSTGLRIPEAPQQSDDFKSAWDQF